MTCLKCGDTMSKIASQFIKKCHSCAYEQPWPLKKDQKPLVANNRVKK